MKKIIICACLLVSNLLYGQGGIDNLWMMGYESFLVGPPFGGVNINFISGSAVINYIPRPMYFGDISATMCDSNGNVLFYTNGVYVANVADDTMMNGSGLSPSDYTTAVGEYGLYIPQAALIIPKPGSNSQYYLFHGTVDDNVGYAFYIYYSEIDMSLNGGLGSVTSKNNILLNDTLISGRITAVKHANGRDWWIIFHQGHTNRFYLYLVDPSGVHFHASQSIGSNLIFAKGQGCFSPNGNKFAMYDPSNDLDILDFDRCIGQFSNPIHVAINDNAAGGGVAISPNSEVLYVSSTSYVYQFDLSAANIPSTKTTVAVWDSFYSPSPPAATTFYLSQLAPDGKIYMSCTNSSKDIHVIDYPDSLGLACHVCQHCVHLPAYDGFTIPNLPNYHLGAWVGSICDTLALSYKELRMEDEDVLVFPNPVTKILYATLNGKFKIQNIKVFNAFGQEMPLNFSLIKNGKYLELNTSSLSQGIYFLELLSDKEKVVKRFVKE